MSRPNADNLYLKPENLEFLYVSQFPNDRDPYLDIDFADGEPCAQAVLTYDFEAKAWLSLIVTSNHPEGDMNQEHQTSPEQHAALLEALPPRLKRFQEEAEALYQDTGSFKGLEKLDLAEILRTDVAVEP
jgi:hypothetical protein